MLPWVVVTRAQLTKLVYERNQGRSIIMSAQKSGMSRNTARNHLRQDDVLKQEKVPHTWRTRKDPLEGIWPEALKMLREAPDLEAKALFDHGVLCTSPKNAHPEENLRSFPLFLPSFSCPRMWTL